MAAVLFSAIASVGKGRPELFVWCLSTMLCAAASFSVALAFPLPFRLLSRRLTRAGAALAGWEGIRRQAEKDNQGRFCDVAANAEAMESLRDLVSFIRYPEKYSRFGARIPRGVLLYGMPGGPYDLALLFKVIPCLEQIDKFGGRHLLSQLSYSSRYAAVSFPGASLSGKEKGMPRNYEVHFMNIVDQEAWEIRKVKFPTELVFILKSKVFYE